MHQDYLTAIHNDEPTLIVFRRLCAIEDETHKRVMQSLEQEAEICENVKAALKEDPESVMYKWALSYLQQAQKNEVQKTEVTLRSEEIRRKIEAEYLNLKEKENEDLRRYYHSDR